MDEDSKPSAVSECYPILQEFPLSSNLLGLIPAKAQKGLSTFDIDFTCIDADSQYLAIGTNVGIVYLFDREKGCLHKLRDPDLKDKITCVKVLLSLECLVAFGSRNGTVLVFKVPFQTEDEIEKFTVEGLHTSTVSALEWARNGMKFFSGDETGTIVCTEIDHFEHLSRSRVLMNENCKIVQLSYSHFNLVVSTHFRSLIYSCKLGTFKQIGQKERKCFGPFGAIIMENDDGEIILASRPGQRLWKSDLSGVIFETMLFKNAISEAHPPIQLLSDFSGNSSLADFQFGRLSKYADKYILVSSDLALLLIDPIQKAVVASCPKLDPISDVCTSKNEIFILRGLRHLIGISSEGDPFANIKPVEEPSIIEEILVPFKEFSTYVKERSDSLSQQIDKNPTIFDWLKKKRSQSSPADFSHNSLVCGKEQNQDGLESLPEVVKLSSAEFTPIKLENLGDSNVSKPAIQSILKDDSEDIVFKPKKKNKKNRKVRFASDIMNKSKQKTSKNFDSKLSNENENVVNGNENCEINTDIDNLLHRNPNNEMHKHNITNNSALNDNMPPNITDNDTEIKKDFPTSENNIESNENDLKKNPLVNNKKNVDDDLMLEIVLNAYSNSKCHEENTNTDFKSNSSDICSQSVQNKLPSNNSHKNIDLNNLDSVDTSMNTLQRELCISVNDGDSNKVCLKDDANLERLNDSEEIYSSFDSEKNEQELHDSTLSNDLSGSLSEEESSANSIDICGNEPLKYGVNWVEYKAPELLLDFSISNEHIFCVDVQNKLYFSKYPVLGLQWIELGQPAEKIAVSPSENVVWALYNGTVYAAVQKSPYLWVDTEWLSAARNVISIAVDDDVGWYVTTNGQLLVQQKLSAAKPYGYPQSVPCKSPVFQVASRNGVVWVLTMNGFLLGSKCVDTKNMLWKDIKLNEVSGINSICLGVQQTGWIVDTNGIIRFLIGVTPETPEGIGKPWQVEEIRSYLPQHTTQLHKTVLKALNTEALNSLIRGKQNICISTSAYDIWFCKTYDNLLYSSQKSVIGHTWELVVPRSTASTTKWSLITAAGISNSEGALWCINSVGELFCFCISSKSLITVELPFISGIQYLEPSVQSLWLLSVEGTIFIRRGITPSCLQGAWWQALDLTQLASKQIISISCSTNVSWACTVDGEVIMRLGTLSPSPRSKLPQAWIPIGRETEETTSPIINKVFVGPLGYPVWAMDRRGSLYVREGVTPNLPIGSKWTSVPELLAKDLCISRNAVWLLKHSGKIYRRFGVSEKNPCGLYWKKMPGVMDYISVTEDDDLWGLKDGAMFCHSSFVISNSIKNNERKLASRSISEDDWEDITADDLESDL